MANIPEPARHPALIAMFDQCIEHQLPKHYVADFVVHDVHTINNVSDDTPFVWLLRECGTHLFFHCQPDLDKLFSFEIRRLYVWTGHILLGAKDGNDANQLLSSAYTSLGARGKATCQACRRTFPVTDLRSSTGMCHRCHETGQRALEVA